MNTIVYIQISQFTPTPGIDLEGCYEKIVLVSSFRELMMAVD